MACIDHISKTVVMDEGFIIAYSENPLHNDSDENSKENPPGPGSGGKPGEYISHENSCNRHRLQERMSDLKGRR